MFIIKQEHKWLLSELDELIPWERDVYIAQLNAWLQKKFEQAGNK